MSWVSVGAPVIDEMKDRAGRWGLALGGALIEAPDQYPIFRAVLKGDIR